MNFVNWAETYPGLAAWVQGIGTILALLIAIAVPAYQERSRRRDDADLRRMQARGLAVQMISDISEFHEMVEREWARFSSLPEDAERNYDHDVEMAMAYLLSVRIYPNGFVDLFYFFGSDSHRLFQVVTAFDYMKAVLEKIRNTHDEAVIRELAMEFKVRFSELRPAVLKAKHVIECHWSGMNKYLNL